ncbi:MAG: dihydrofolate synthase / folylpolyglutamate synthase [Sphingomonadales bacterium]|jgi:dihydrofolate synthase/folylpolyglutamate synthase|nr:dihydrofolate synthase / folylpolyglutamate synthase [Sphingomonadales bacterium]
MMADKAASDNPQVQAQLDRLAMVSPGRDILGLERISELLRRLGNPERALPPVLHVAGTNGKGSTCAFLRAAIEAAGARVHSYTSPHLIRFNERIRLGGRLIDDALLAQTLSDTLDAVGDREITFFEATTASAFLAFSRVAADACIVEVGLGGRFDATNVLSGPAVCGIAQLGVDHTAFLGEAPDGIAAEKAGIAKPGVPLVTQNYPEAQARRVKEAAAAAGAIWLPRGESWDFEMRQDRLHYSDRTGALDLPLPRLSGTHQAENAALAIAMLRHQSALEIGPQALSAAMDRAEWPGRLQRLRPGPVRDLLPGGAELWVDGAHNAAAAHAVAGFLRARVPEGRPLHLVFGLLSDRDPAAVLAPFRGLPATVHAIPIAGFDCQAAEVMSGAARALGLAASSSASFQDALRAIARQADPARPPVVLVIGSLYLAGEVLKANLQPPD